MFSDPLYNNIAAALVVLVYVKTVIAICDELVRRKMLKPSDSRKVVHVAAGSWLLFWNLFDESHWTWMLNIFVPAAFTFTLTLKGAIIQDKNDPDVRTMSRTGEPYELLLGPLFFTIVMDTVGIYFFRTQVGALMMAALGVGDGVGIRAARAPFAEVAARREQQRRHREPGRHTGANLERAFGRLL